MGLLHVDVFTLLLAGVLGMLLVWLAIKSTGTWLVIGILSHLILFIHKPYHGISVYQMVAYSMIFYPGLIWWYVKSFSESKKLVENRAELAFTLFMALALASIGWAQISGFSAFKGLREYALFISYLMYFPIRDYVAEKGYRNMLIALLAVCMSIALFDIVEYRLKMAVASYMWQILGGRENLGEPLMMSAIIVFFGFIAAKRYNRNLIIVLIAISSIALVLTFSRGYWGSTAFGLLLLVIFLNGAPRKRIITLSALSVLTVVAVAAILFPKLLVDLFVGVGHRLAMLGGRDLSLQSRLLESGAALKDFARSPILGYGLGARFTFFDPISYMTSDSWYIHNGYVFLLFKFGIVGTFLYMVFYLHIIASTWREASRSIVESDKVLLLSFTSVMGAMLLVNLTSPQFYDRVSILIVTVMWGITAGISRRRKLSESATNEI